MSRIVRLFPEAWRDRYGDELAALLEERGVRTRDLVDLALGALDAHLHGPRTGGRAGMTRVLRASIGSASAVAAGVLWVVTVLTVISDGAENGGLMLMTFASSMLVLALAAFGAGSSPHPRLVAVSLLPSVAGVVLLLGGIGLTMVVGDRPVLGDLTPYAFWITGLLLALAGAVLFGVVATIVGSLPRAMACLLGAGALVQAVTMFATDHTTQGSLLVLGAAAFGCSWTLAGFGFWRTRSNG